MMRILLLVVLGLLMHAARQFAPLEVVGSGPAGITLSCGFLLITSILFSSLLTSIGLPSITAYLIVGAVVGPEILDLVSVEMLDGLNLFRSLAVPFIALLAGTELHFPSLGPGLRGAILISVMAVVTSFAAVTGAGFAARDLLPFLDGLDTTTAVTLCGLVGLALAAGSPSIAVAMRDDADAEGPVVRSVMAVVVLVSLLLVAAVAVASPVATGMLSAPGDAARIAGKLAWTLFGSLAFGVGAGVAFAKFLRKLHAGGTLFAIGLSFAAAELGPRIGLDPLALALAAGIYLRHATDLGPRVLRDMQPMTLPVYVAYFAVAGAMIPLSSFGAVWLGALVLFAARAVGLNLGWRLGARIAGAPEAVRRHGGIGLVPQADLALALAVLVAGVFPQPGVLDLIAAVVGLNALFGPIFFRFALVKAGEAGRRSALARELTEDAST